MRASHSNTSSITPMVDSKNGIKKSVSRKFRDFQPWSPLLLFFLLFTSRHVDEFLENHDNGLQNAAAVAEAGQFKY